MKLALVRAARTFVQVFAGTLAGVNVTLDASFVSEIVVAAISAGIGAFVAFGMNLPSVEGVANVGRD